jgi:Tol biopolymer transport system component
MNRKALLKGSPLLLRVISILLLVAVLVGVMVRIIEGKRATSAGSAWAWQQPPESNEGILLFVTTDSSGQTIQGLPVEATGPVTSSISPAIANGVVPIPTGCTISGQAVSPDGQQVVISIGCEYGSYTQILDVNTGQIYGAEAISGQDSIFLDWAPDGDSVVMRVDPIGKNEIVLVNLEEGTTERLDTPAFTYNAEISPDNQRVLYTVSRGLGLGGELWIMNRDGSDKQLLLQEPDHIIAYPRWSPKGDAIAYIRMQDTNIPFTVGELCLADGNGQNRRVIAEADAGHGYPPVWSPDGKKIAFIVRENPRNVRADNLSWELESNIYLVDVQTGEVWPLTQFNATTTDGIVWSPNGTQLAFRTTAEGISDIWLIDVETGAMQRITYSAGASYPVWLSENTNR